MHEQVKSMLTELSALIKVLKLSIGTIITSCCTYLYKIILMLILNSIFIN
jgi:hypothetical protein